MEWIDKLKVGDSVFISSRYSGAPELAKVKRLTSTRVMVEYGRSELAFHKKNGWLVGADVWSHRSLLEPTPERYRAAETEKLRNIAIKLRDKLPIPQTEEELLKFIEALKPFIKSQEAL